MSDPAKPVRKKPRVPTEERLTRITLAYLERYATSLANLRRVLTRRVEKAAKAHERDVAEFLPLVEIVLEKAARSGLVNDEVYAETKAASLRRKGASSRQITAKLSARGVSRSVIEETLARDDSDSAAAARRYAQRRRLGPWRKGWHDEDGAARRDRDRKDLAALCRAGHGLDVARKALQGAEDELG
ncbi:regulatory protein RecX [Pannonibacter sp.]|uniref:regulatory protein RecX n=1 Tax=Pannonibacter sp. TaxID=1906786 RepID=UPI003F6E9D9D